MIVVMNRIPVTPGFAEAFEERFQNRRGLIEVIPGFLRNEMLRPLQGDHYIVKTYWRTREDVEHWIQSEAFRRAHATRPLADMCSGPSIRELYEIVQESGVLLIPVRGLDWP